MRLPALLAVTMLTTLCGIGRAQLPLVLVLGAQDLTVECDGIGNGMSLASWLAIRGGALASSECGGVSWINDFSGLEYDGCGTTGEVSVTFTVSDNCGVTISTTAVFKIEDTAPPYVDAAVAVEIPCSEYQPGQPYGNLEYADINGEVTVNFFDVPILGSECTTIYIRTYTATDVCNNTSSIQQYINLTGDLAPGCPDSSACNFDSNATNDDGSCIYPEEGYTCDGTCINDANDDGICDSFCQEDLNSDGFITTQDLLLILSEFGCITACENDINQDGYVAVDDLLLVLSEFGNMCD